MPPVLRLPRMSSLEQPAAPAAAPAKHSVLMIAEDLPCGGKTLKATLPAGKACGASTLLKLFAKRFALDWAALALRPPEGALLLAGDRVVFGDELSVFTVVLAPAPEAAEPLSAHATVAVYDGAAGGRATFRSRATCATPPSRRTTPRGCRRRSPSTSRPRTRKLGSSRTRRRPR